MKFFDRFFHNGDKRNIYPMPEWETVVETMYDKQLDSFVDEVIDVVYSKDHSMRYVILKNAQGLFTYQLEVIHQFDDNEWQYVCSDKNSLPAIWEPFKESAEKSIFESKNELLKEMKSEAEYRRYF